MAQIYSYTSEWIREDGLEEVWQDTLHIEIYEKPIGPEITGNEEVQVCLAIKE